MNCSARIAFVRARQLGSQSKQLVIDPVIQYSRYLGREGQESAIAVAADSAAMPFMSAKRLPTSLRPAPVCSQMRKGDSDIFIAKLDYCRRGSVHYVSGRTGTGDGTRGRDGFARITST